MAKRPRLRKDEIAGIRLIADLFVIKELQSNVLNKDEAFKNHADELDKHLRQSVPRVFAAEAELQKQITEVRKQWLKELQGMKK